MKLLWVVLTFWVCTAKAKNDPTCTDTPYCDPNTCKLPDCACTDTEPDVPVGDRPQIVYLTFDDGISKLFDDQYFSELFMPDNNGNYKYTNPNGCPIKATFFVAGKNNDYQITHKYWRYYHEIAAHSITHRTDMNYWKTMNESAWTDEYVGVRQMISEFANIPESDIKGVRVPFLQGGGDDMFKMMANNGFEYDCSAPTLAYGYKNMQYGRWPYTLDYYSDMDCQIEPCPTCSFPGIWSQPLLAFEDGRVGENPADPDHGYPCSMVDTCLLDSLGQIHNATLMYEMLMKNFQRSYTGKTRAPIGIYLHAAWFIGTYSWHFDAYKMFLDEITSGSYDDVWVVPIRKGIEYLQANNVTNADLLNGDFEAFNCNADPLDDDCNITDCSYNVNNVDIPGPVDYRLHRCGFTCPRNFPWLGNPLGQ